MSKVQMEVQTKEGAEALEQLAELRRKNAELEAQVKAAQEKTKSIRFELGRFTDRKGNEQVNIMVHGITPKPFPLYASQALRLCEVAPKLAEFVEAHRAELSWKS